jgi:hypothetical protein
MADLLTTVLDAHGGLARWNTFSTITAHLEQGGILWAVKARAGLLDSVRVTVNLRDETASHAPFGGPGRRSRFTPDRVVIESETGAVQDELLNPRDSFAGHVLETPWTDLQLAYFAGCAMWTYLNTPFLLAHPGVSTEEIEPWHDGGTTWRRLRAAFPAHIATHSREQTLYVDGNGLIARHDYDVEIAGGTPGAHFVSDYVGVSGIKFPTKRRIFPRQPDGRAAPEPLVVSIDLSAITLS